MLLVFQICASRSNREPIVYVNDRTIFTVDIETAIARIIYPISGTVQIFCLLWVHYASLHSNSPGAERSTFEISDPSGNSWSTFLINGARVFLFSIRSRWSPGLLKNSWLLPSYFILMYTPTLGLGYASYPGIDSNFTRYFLAVDLFVSRENKCDNH